MSTTGYWILRCEHQLLTVAHDESGQIFPRARPPLLATRERDPRRRARRASLLRRRRGAVSRRVAAAEARPLRAIFQLAGDACFALAGRASQLLDWQANHRFCGRCGTPTR